jgi:ABC-type nickel/cobalt efflux system permease component RcnA
LSTLRRLLIVLFACWLPVANAWVLVAPCAHEADGASAALDMPCHRHHPAAQGAGQSGHTCDGCSHCHLSSASTLPSYSPAEAKPLRAVEHARPPFVPTPYTAKPSLPPPVR